MVKRNLAKFIKLLMVSGAVLILTGIFYLKANQADTASHAKEGSMIPANSPANGYAEIPQIDVDVPAVFETASFGLGWFWGIESRFGTIEGVIRTRVGYAGGSKNAPTYRNLGDHTETVQVDFDPKRITYARLLDVFWKSPGPRLQSGSRQYINAIFYHNVEQRRQALVSRADLEQKTGHAVKTEVVPVRSFTLAEDYHQKYYLKNHPDMLKEMTRIYPNPRDFVDSTAVTRLNGYSGGYGTGDQLSREIDIIGLSAGGKKQLMKLAGRKMNQCAVK